MKLKVLLGKFGSALDALYGKARAVTAAAKTRLDETIVARPGTFDGAVAASMVRDLSHADLSRRKKNGRGLPKGYGLHDLKRAKRIKNRASRATGENTEIDIHFAETFFADVKRTNALRAARPRPSKKARRAASAWQIPTLAQLKARITTKLDHARKSGRVPFLRKGPKLRERLRASLHPRKHETSLMRRLPGGAYEGRA